MSRKLPSDLEMEESITTVLRHAHGNQRQDFPAAHAEIVKGMATDGLKALRLLPDLKAALGAKASKASKDKALAKIAELTGEKHEPEPEATPEE